MSLVKTVRYVCHNTVYVVTPQNKKVCADCLCKLSKEDFQLCSPRNKHKTIIDTAIYDTVFLCQSCNVNNLIKVYMHMPPGYDNRCLFCLIHIHLLRTRV